MKTESCDNCGTVLDLAKLDYNCHQTEQAYKNGVEGLFKIARCPVCRHHIVGESAE